MIKFVYMEEMVVLVDPKDNVLGRMDKLVAHQTGVLHRAFSVFLFNQKGEMLLQQRAKSKYHSPGQWTNACCSHPRLLESYKDAAKRRLMEELGIEVSISEKFHFIYKASVGGELTEHELDHVFTGIYDGKFHLNPEEVMNVRYISLEELEKEMQAYPNLFTPWFTIILNEYKQHL